MLCFELKPGHKHTSQTVRFRSASISASDHLAASIFADVEPNSCQPADMRYRRGTGPNPIIFGEAFSRAIEPKQQIL